MAYVESQVLISLPAASDLSATPFRFVTVDSSGNIALSAAVANAAGVLQDKPTALGQPGSVAIGGVTKVTASAAIAAGAAVGCAASGKARTAAVGDYIQGITLEAAAADGNIISMLIKPGGKL